MLVIQGINPLSEWVELYIFLSTAGLDPADIGCRAKGWKIMVFWLKFSSFLKVFSFRRRILCYFLYIPRRRAIFSNRKSSVIIMERLIFNFCHSCCYVLQFLIYPYCDQIQGVWILLVLSLFWRVITISMIILYCHTKGHITLQRWCQGQ